MAGAGPVTPAELAARTGTHERYVREWLATRPRAATSTYDPERAFTLPPEQALALADERARSPLPGRSRRRVVLNDQTRIAERVPTGDGHRLARARPRPVHRCAERFFRPGYAANLVPSWLPALDGVVEKLRQGATRRRRRLRPRRVDDPHGPGLPAVDLPRLRLATSRRSRRRAAAAEAGVADRVRFEVAAADAFPAAGYDLVACSTACTTWATRSGVARHVR